MTAASDAAHAFVDRNGTQWEVFEIHPQRVERRGTERRVAPAGTPAPKADRRRAVDRRTQFQQRVRLAAEYVHGWLLLVSARGERRRVAPIPPRWRHLSTTALELMTRVGELMPGRG